MGTTRQAGKLIFMSVLSSTHLCMVYRHKAITSCPPEGLNTNRDMASNEDFPVRSKIGL